MNKSANSSLKVLDMTYIAIFTVLTAVCSWISIPSVVPFTLQTFGVFLTILVLGGKRGTFSILVYILSGMVGIPVFSKSEGGIGKILGPTGGYIIGFLIISLIYWLLTAVYGEKLYIKIIALITGLIFLYTFGTAWFMFVYIQNKGALSLATALLWCVVPFIIPDIVKMSLAFLLAGRISKYIKK